MLHVIIFVLVSVVLIVDFRVCLPLYLCQSCVHRVERRRLVGQPSKIVPCMLLEQLLITDQRLPPNTSILLMTKSTHELPSRSREPSGTPHPPPLQARNGGCSFSLVGQSSIASMHLLSFMAAVDKVSDSTGRTCPQPGPARQAFIHSHFGQWPQIQRVRVPVAGMPSSKC